jgi:hypothetical protein
MRSNRRAIDGRRDSGATFGRLVNRPYTRSTMAGVTMPFEPGKTVRFPNTYERPAGVTDAYTDTYYDHYGSWRWKAFSDPKDPARGVGTRRMSLSAR